MVDPLFPLTGKPLLGSRLISGSLAVLADLMQGLLLGHWFSEDELLTVLSNSFNPLFTLYIHIKQISIHSPQNCLCSFGFSLDVYIHLLIISLDCHSIHLYIFITAKRIQQFYQKGCGSSCSCKAQNCNLDKYTFQVHEPCISLEVKVPYFQVAAVENI